jgi:hypothetical protein
MFYIESEVVLNGKSLLLNWRTNELLIFYLI